MEEYIFTKSFFYNSSINEVSNILLDHEFENQLEDDGVHIRGNIYITFVVSDDVKMDYEAIQIPVDLFISLNKIDCLKDLKLIIDHFEHVVKDSEVEFKIVTKLLGNNEELISFEPTKNKEINRSMMDLLMRGDEEQDEISFENNFLNNIENFITKDNVDLISTPYEELDLNRNDIIEISTLEKEIKESFDDLKEEAEQKNEYDIMPLNKEMVKQKVEDDGSMQVEKKQEQEENTSPKNESKQELFKEKYISNYFYYRLKDNETITDVANLFNLKEEDILKLNKNIEFKKGQLLKIAK